ncbi:MAG: Maf family protein [Dehalococcoidales bacterium]|nr:Maf family protein [Dehalococcoidales bacterium]
MNSRQIILASASPRRQELLEKTGLTFTVDPADYEEKLDPSLNPQDLAASISQGKARAAAAKHADAIIIAADTFGVLRGKLLGKPHTAGEARKMLRAISGKSHLVITGLTILDSATGKSITRTATTRVYIKKLSPQEIDSYIKTGEPLDKAGAYGIQGKGALIVEKIAGDYYNVVGLPLQTLSEGLKEMGINLLQDS